MLQRFTSFLSKTSTDTITSMSANTTSDAIKSKFMLNKKLGDELHKSIIKNFKRHETNIFLEVKNGVQTNLI